MGLNVELLESSFKLVAPKGDALVTRFYERLFKKYPSVKPLFKKTSIKEKKKKQGRRLQQQSQYQGHGNLLGIGRLGLISPRGRRTFRRSGRPSSG